MRVALCILALTVSGWAAEVDNADSADSAAPEQAQTTPAPADAPKPADAAKPADATPPPPPPKYGGWAFSALADGYSTYNNLHPPLGFNPLQNFDLHSGAPRLSLAKFTVDKSDKVFGIHIDVGVGETMRLIHAGDVAAQEHKGLRYVEQMYLIAKPNHTHGTEIDFGQFVTSAGAEVIESSSNWNYTRSLLFAWAIPYYHFGLKTTTPVTKELTVGVQVVNAWNTVWGNHNFQNVGLTLAYTKPKYTYSLNYYEGKSDIGTNVGTRNLLDTTLLLTPNSKLSFYINGDWGRDNIYGGGYNQWYGLAGAGRYQLTKMFAVAARTEFFNDPRGFETGTAQVIKEGTITGEGKINDHLVARLEYRHDASNHAFFEEGNDHSLHTGMNTLTIGVVGLLGPLK
jgi:Putative beta-barrel porin-2, OmpL-like. bbp2